MALPIKRQERENTMAESYSRPEGADKHQNIPKVMLILLIVCLLALVIAGGYVMAHRHAAAAGQPADQARGPQLGAEGPANNVNGRAVTPEVKAGAGQCGGPGAMGSGAGAGQETPGTAGTRMGGTSSGPAVAPSAGGP